MNIRDTIIAGVLAVAAGTAAAADTGTVFIDSRLLATPAFNGDQLAKVPAGTEVTILEGQGLWLQVSLAGDHQRGWIRRFDVRTEGSRQTVKRDSGGGLFSFFSSSRREPRVTNTIGIRGLDAVDIDNARSDPRQLERLASYRADMAAAARLAGDGGLRSQEVAYVAEGAGESREEDSGGGGFGFGF